MMPNTNIIDNKDVKQTYQLYPENVQHKLLIIRQMIFDIAKDNAEINPIEETLKWGEPAYLTKSGATIRLAWKPSTPDKYAVYFICSTTLLETFKEIYPDIFTYDGNRAIVFSINDNPPIKALEHCLLLSLTYHKVKHLPLLGV